MSHIQRILYNHCGPAYRLAEMDSYVYLHTDAQPQTPVGVLSFHIYSKLLHYAAGQDWVQALTEQEDDARWYEVDSYSAYRQAYAKTLDTKTVIHVIAPSEPYLYRYIQNMLQELQEAHEYISFRFHEDPQRYCSHQEFTEKYEKPPIMETYYRRMRKKTGILMDDDKPVGGKWNYDKENRKFDPSFESFQKTHVREPSAGWKKACAHYEYEVGQYQERHGYLQPHVPTNTKQAQRLLEYFVEEVLERFGALEDAMYVQSAYVHHSRLSTAINMGMLLPSDVVQAIEQAHTPINNKEGYIRQLLGRREYMYHWHWHYHDTIYQENVLEHHRPLPSWFRETQDEPTEMNCLRTVLQRVDRLSYSHHIERLMIIGNIALLVNIDPMQLTKRFREQYNDAYERVVVPNVMGMSQYADGGNLATKPYVSSANYVKKMSNFCDTCKYDPKKKTGKDACPLNVLYRNFIAKHKNHIKKARQSFILKHWEKRDEEDQNLIREEAAHFIDRYFPAHEGEE